MYYDNRKNFLNKKQNGRIFIRQNVGKWLAMSLTFTTGVIDELRGEKPDKCTIYSVSTILMY